MNLRDACRRLRFRQVRAFSKVFCRLAVLPGMKKILGTVGKSDLCAKVLVGFNRTFPSFEDANQCALQHGFPSHEHPGNITNHLRLNENARLSDYPVLFHLQNLLGERHLERHGFRCQKSFGRQKVSCVNLRVYLPQAPSQS